MYSCSPLSYSPTLPLSHSPTLLLSYLSQTTAWILYALHQLGVWWTIFVAQREYNENGGFLADGVNKAAGPKYTRNVRRINVIALAINFVFWVAHLIHTHLVYDALAPTTHEMSSQGRYVSYARH